MRFGPAIRRDEGFSVAEVVIAASILFFVLTAMVGLVGASQKMTVSARQKTAITNATAAYIDRLRAIDYEDIAIEPAGTVKAVEEISYGDYVVTFNNRVDFRDGLGGAKLRTLYVRATATIYGKTFTHSAVVDISNPKDDTHASSLIDPNDPVITFTSQTPPEHSVVVWQVDAPEWLVYSYRGRCSQS
jgi:Tfp pilus assembly protein PilV